MTKTQSNEIKHRLRAQGHTLKSWAEAHGFNCRTVSHVLNGLNRGNYGEGRDIMIALGLNPDEASVISDTIEPFRPLGIVQDDPENGIPMIEMPKHMRVACDEAMVREFNGLNHAELARRWKISAQWVYCCVKAAHRKQLETALQARPEAEGSASEVLWAAPLNKLDRPHALIAGLQAAEKAIALHGLGHLQVALATLPAEPSSAPHGRDPEIAQAGAEESQPDTQGLLGSAAPLQSPQSAHSSQDS